jgi:succinate dehydrogenase hydrophobic anchor subunit
MRQWRERISLWYILFVFFFGLSSGVQLAIRTPDRQGLLWFGLMGVALLFLMIHAVNGMKDVGGDSSG